MIIQHINRVYEAEENAQRPEYRKCGIPMALQRNKYIDKEAILSINLNMS